MSEDKNTAKISRAKNRIASFYKANKRMPTYAEIMILCDFKSKNAVYRLVEKLSEESFLSKDGTGKLVPKNIFGEVRMLGIVEAGFPTAAEEDTSDMMSLDEYLIDNREATYMLKVKGDSMIDAAIREGDMVLVERTQNYKPGDIVIAEVDGAWTMKYLRKQGNYFFLEAANKKYKPILPKEDLRIAAVVRAVIRKF
jgi:SOS regulatory protein LexA